MDKLAEILLLPFSALGVIRAFWTRKVILSFIAGYFCLAILSSAGCLAAQRGNSYPAISALLGVMLDLKPFVYAFGCYELFSRSWCDHERAIAIVIRTILAIALINAAFVLRDLIFGDTSIWRIPLGNGPLGFPLAVGLYNHKYPSACTTLCGALAALSLIHERMTAARFVLFSLMLILLVFNGSLKEIIAAIVAVVLFLILPSSQNTLRMFRTKAFVAIMFAGVAVGTLSYMSQIMNNRYRDYAVEASVRTALYSAAYSIARENFPVGSGAGTFASMPSRDVDTVPLTTSTASLRCIRAVRWTAAILSMCGGLTCSQRVDLSDAHATCAS